MVNDGTSQDDLATLESCTVLDVFEQDLKSKQNYKDAIHYLLTCIQPWKSIVNITFFHFQQTGRNFIIPKNELHKGEKKDSV